MKLLKFAIFCSFVLFLSSCSKNDKPDKKLIEQLIVTNYKGVGSVNNLKCRYGDIIKEDSIRFLTVIFDADVTFNFDYTDIPDFDLNRMKNYSAGETKSIYNGEIHFIDKKGYWQVASFQIK